MRTHKKQKVRDATKPGGATKPGVTATLVREALKRAADLEAAGWPGSSAYVRGGPRNQQAPLPSPCLLVDRYESGPYVVVATKVAHELFHVWALKNGAEVFSGKAASLAGAMSLGMTLGR